MNTCFIFFVKVKPEYVNRHSLLTILDTPEIYPEPYGVALIVGAWNYPFTLTLGEYKYIMTIILNSSNFDSFNLGPLAGAIAAGNCIVLKPSEMSEASAVLIKAE